MSIKLGSKFIGALNLGASPINKLYLGDNLVFGVEVVEDDATSGTNWDTFVLGAGTIVNYSSSANTITYHVDYPNTTAASQFNALNVSPLGTSPYQKTPLSNYTSAVMKDYMAPYAAVYVHAAEAASGDYGKNDTEGWYVFGPGEDRTPGVNGYIEWRTPVAWPTGANNDDGYIGINNSVNYEQSVAWLSDYKGGLGSGGTDSWTTPDLGSGFGPGTGVGGTPERGGKR